MSLAAERAIQETIGVEFRARNFIGVPLGDSPFTEPIGMRGWLVTFASHLLTAEALTPGLARDIEMQSRWELGTCAYGASDPPVLPFICELRIESRPLAADILVALNARDFRSEHIPTLQATRISYPGYHPYSQNDEIQNDFKYQNIFESEIANEDDGIHGEMKRNVDEGQLWYVLLHPKRYEGICDFVFLFAVGRSLDGKRLVGIVTYQVCHNLCD